jgi:hypothetical protein
MFGLMTTAVAGPTLILEFFGARTPRLRQTQFCPRNESSDSPPKTLKCGAGSGRNQFQWRQGPMALCYCLLDYVCWSRGQKRKTSSKYVLQGERESPVKTLDNGMGKYLNWMNSMFGQVKDGQNCRLNEYIRRLNPDQASKKRPFELEVQTENFPASSISVCLDGKKINDVETLDWLAEAVAEQWHKATGNQPRWRSFKNQRRERLQPAKKKNRKRDVSPPRAKATRPKLGGPPAPGVDIQREWPGDKPIDLSIYYPVIIGKPSSVFKADLVQFRGKFIKGYLCATLPDVNPPPHHMQNEWLDSGCSIVLANHLLKEPIENVLGLFHTDEIAIRDWAKEKIATAIWQNLEWQEELPRRIAASSPKLKQMWNQESAEFFPQEARDEVFRALSPVSTK